MKMLKTKRRWSFISGVAGVWLCVASAAMAQFASLEPASTASGYLARLLVNESPFPGERGYLSEDDTKATMLSILWVLHSRMNHIPEGYKQEEIAAIRSQNILDVITAKNQCEGFFKDAAGKPATAPRVEERIRNLLKIANSGGKPGRFASLLAFGQGLANAYLSSGIPGADRFAGLTIVNQIAVTGRAYSWMTGKDYYSPGGNFVKIPDAQQGLLGGNRFFTLRKDPQ
ncbi:MAG: hypothetical protein KBC66_05860 [Kiritimatiellae bacterium]|jgi:hypothetical protein|nr:hypothetical protein [Kiritimatiellia bacterium]NLD90886.1 hypothetical protein [Lentisphaerota bacterium]HOU21468.1 hypothetical protein [Kiritimatiellia bacterium]HPC18792.1 hypothetical protein [Kiritimatiellia bacterium]HQN80038.1 hypothetical protein [Kiritimatiellia bacterium]